MHCKLQERNQQQGAERTIPSQSLSSAEMERSSDRIKVMTTHIAMYLSDVARSREALSFKIDPSSPFSQILLPPDMRETHWSIAHGSFPPRRHRPFFHRLSFRHQTINTRTASSRHPSVSRARAPTPPPPQSHISLSFPFSANLVVSQLTLASHTQTDRVLRMHEIICTNV